jgi:hypothetical protein
MRDIGGRERESGRATSMAQQRIEIGRERLPCWHSAVSGEQRKRVSSGQEWKNENQWRKKEMEEEEGVGGAKSEA